MSVLTADPSVWAPPAVFLASFLGSAHCASMCGGLILSFAPTRAGRARYHAGRLMGYLALGGMAGLLGAGALSGAAPRWISALASLVIGAGLIASGIAVIRGRGFHFPLLPPAVLGRLSRAARGRAGWGGALSAILPCGWLHVFILGALATRDPARGALLLLAFWAGTLPALAAVPWIGNGILRPFSLRMPKLSALLLIGVGTLCIAVRWIGSFREGSASTTPASVCHGSESVR